MNNNKPRKKDSARLTWDNKPRRAPNPKDIEFQTAEVVIPNPQTAGELPLSFRDGIIGEEEIDKQKMNRLIWRDNLLAMQALLAQGYEGKINLIYIDPPFDSKADYSHKMTISSSVIPAQAGIQSVEFTKEPSVIERLAYKDTWTGGTDSYLDMLYPRLQLMKRLLAADGSIYIHLDYHIAHYVKVIADEVFGKENLINEIIWRRTSNPKGSQFDTKKLGQNTDTIFLYAKSSNYYFDIISAKRPLTDSEIEQKYNKIDEKGRYYPGPIVCSKSMGPRPNLCYEYKGYYPPYKSGWRLSKDKLIELDNNGDLGWTEKGTPFRKLRPQKFEGEPLFNLWDDIFRLYGTSSEILDYATQKPKELIERIINLSCPNGGIVADFFAGSGTTGAVAEELERPWILCELGKVGVQVTRSRLVEQGAKPFLIENIGNYQREMIYLTGGRIWEMQHLILKLYGAMPRDKTSGLGIRKAEDGTDELVYVGGGRYR